MASMVAKACSSTSSQMPSMTLLEKGSRNKRKFRADTLLADPNKIIPLPSNECTSFEFSAEIFDSYVNSNGCDMCCYQDNSDSLKLDLGLALTRPREEIEALSDEFHDADWSNFTESELEELVLINLDSIFKSAIKKIIASGYSEEVATKAILRSGLWYGRKDTVSNIVDNTLTFLKSGHEIDPSREHQFEDLQQMEKYIFVELVCLLREVRPFFSTGDAMWCLLICDMNVTQACAMDSDPLSGFVGEAGSNLINTSNADQPQLRTEFEVQETNVSIPCKPNPSVAYAQNCPLDTPNLTNRANLKPKASFVVSGLVPNKECQKSMSNINDKPFSATTEEKFVGSRKVSGIMKRDYILRQKSIHLEKHYRTYGSKGTSRARKLSAFGGLVLDKKLKGVAVSTCGNANKKSSFKNNKAVGFDVPADNANHISLSLPVADTELSLSFPAQTIANPIPISYSIEGADYSYIDSSNDKSLGKWAHQDRKEEMIMKLVPRVKELQSQLQEWTEWANQKVMQAARRLSKDKAELKTLRQEKEEVEKLKKEKLTLEESTMKKLSEMENALRKASGQVERANGAVRRLEFDNSALRREMEVAKLRAAESAASCREVVKREKKILVKFQSWEKQKSAIQEDLSAEKCKLMQLQQKLQQAKDIKDQVEAKLNQEERAKHHLLTQAHSFRKERDQIEASAKSKEDTIKSKAETNLQKYKTNIERLQKEISQLRFKTDSSKIAALRRGTNGPYTNKLTELKTIPSLKYFGGVKRERECVMCLSEEMSVVFLPCAHQVVCTMCNELHEKQGMKECPSCRTPIHRRVSVRYAHS